LKCCLVAAGQGQQQISLVKSQVSSSKKPREYAGQMQNAAVFLVKFSGMVNTVFSVSGRKNRGNSQQGANMIKVLEFRYGKPSRVLWPAYEANKAEVEKQVIELTKLVMAATGKRLKINLWL
jgi:hypothetical protein